jgi:hypothetical protein
MLTAFLKGRQSRSLHEVEDMEPLLDSPLSVARAGLAAGRNSSANWHSYGRFALLILESGLVLTLPVAVVGAAIALLA